MRACRLQDRAGRIEACPRAACPFWEPGGAALPSGCVIERTGIDLDSQPELVHALLRVRHQLGRATTREREEDARALFYRLVPAAHDDDA